MGILKRESSQWKQLSTSNDNGSKAETTQNIRGQQKGKWSVSRKEEEQQPLHCSRRGILLNGLRSPVPQWVLFHGKK